MATRVDKDEKPSASRFPTRAAINLVLFSLTMVAIWVGFYRHLQPLFAGAMIFGGVVGVWAIFSLIYGWIKALAGNQIKSMTMDLFRSERITEVLGFILFVCVVVQFFIASIYVQHGGDGKRYEIEVLNEQQTFMNPLEVSTGKLWDGRPYLARFQPVRLSFRIKDNPQFNTVRRTLYLWSSLRLRVPHDFPPRETTVIRLLPSFTLMNCFLPNANEADPATKYDLEIAVGSMKKIHRDFRKRSLYLGGSDDDLDWVMKQQDVDAFKQSLADRLSTLGVPPETHTPWLRHWIHKPEKLVLREFDMDDLVKIRLFRVKTGGDGTEVIDTIFEHEIKVDTARFRKTTTEFLEVPCTG